MAWLWLCIVIVLTLIEVSTINLVTIWFIASGIIAMILSLFVDNYFIQFFIFVILGIILLITTRKYLVNISSNKAEKTNLDRVIGENAIVTLEIDKNKIGEVKIDGKKWSAISSKKIKEGSTVKVLSIEGVKLKVEEVEE